MNISSGSKAALSKDETRKIDLKRLLRLRLPLMLAVFAALAVPGTAAVWKLIPLEYKASADVRFLASTPRVMNSDARENGVPYEKFLNTQIALITGNAVLSQVLEDPQVRACDAVAHNSAPLEFLKAVIKAETGVNSELVTISCKMRDRDTAMLLVDKTLAAYMKYALSEEANTGGERLQVLLKERDRGQVELDSQLRKISDLQQQVEMPSGGATKDRPERSSAYETPHARAEEDISRSDSKCTLLAGQIASVADLIKKYKAAPGKPLFEMGVEDKVAADPRVVAARQEFIKSDAEFAGVAERYGESSPQLEVARGRINALKGRVVQVESAARGEVVSSMQALLEKDLGAAKSELEDAKTRKAGFEDLIEKERARSMEASKTLASVDELKIHAEESRSLLRAVRDEITSIGVESNAPARVKIASPPSVPSGPGTGRRMQALFLLLMMSGAAGLGAGFLREITDQQIRSEEDLSSVTDRPVLAFIPHTGNSFPAPAHAFAGSSRALALHSGGEGFRGRQRASAVAERPDTAIGNEVRKILSSFSLERGVKTGGVVGSCVVTSPASGDGKTLVTCNLAIALTQAGRKVLVLEMSPKAELEEALGMKPARGLSCVLLRGMPLMDAVRPTAFPGLYLVGAGPQPESLTVKAASREMADLIDTAKKEFDHVLIDTPPILATSDAGLLAPVVDGVVLVVGSGVSDTDMVRQATEELRRTRANLLGVVLNCARLSSTKPLPGAVRYEDYLSKKRAAPPKAAGRAVQNSRPEGLRPAITGGIRIGTAVGRTGLG